LSNPRSVPSDSAARDVAVAESGSVLVQAPAGSGKTTLLAQRYLRLLATVDAPERILALTFTRRAAQEMRERVLQALKAARLPECPVGLNPQTWALGVAARRHMDGLKLDLERHPSRLRIETIDALNAWLAGQLPIAAGAGARLQLIEEPKPLYQEAARQALMYEERDAVGAAVERVLELDDQRWITLLKLISDMLPSRDRWLPLLAGDLQVSRTLGEEQLNRVRQHFDEDLKMLVARALARAHECIGPERIGMLSILMRGAAQRVEPPALAEWLGSAGGLTAGSQDIGRWRAMAAVLLTADDKFRKGVNKNQGFAPKSADKALMTELLEELERDPRILPALQEIRVLPDPRYSDEQWERARHMAQVLVLAAGELSAVFREQGAVDFAAVSMAALRALGSEESPTDLNLRLDYRLQHILVDEFQDTSSTQLKLLGLLTAGWQAGDGRSMFCVGDPMQSIYGFRDAEVRAFLELAEIGIGDLKFDVQRLTSNFRSAKTLVDWVNDTFSRILPRDDDRDRGAIAFRPSDSAVDSPRTGDARVEIRGFETPAEEAGAIAEAIASELALHPEWRVAILVRAKAHAREIAHSLRARGIGFRAVDIELLHDRAVVRDLVMLIRALLHFGDRTAWLAVLRAPWAGITLADLLLIARGASMVWDALVDDSVQAQLSADGRARCLRLRSVFEAAFAVRGQTSVARWVERTWLNLGGPSCAPGVQELNHAQAAFVRLREFEQLGLPDAADLDESFADLYADHGEPSSVEIMTIHRAKGLEFDMVVLPALSRVSPRHSRQLLLTHQFARTERDGLVMAARPGVGAEPDRLFEFLRFQARDATDLEAQRLLYVACTRAKTRLLLTAVVKWEAADDAAAEIAVPHQGSLLRVLWPVVASQIQIAPTGGAAETGTALRGGPLQRVPSGWSPDLADAAASNLAEPAALATRPEIPVFDWVGETARRVGSLVHSELQHLDLERSDAAAIRAREPHYKRWLTLQGVPADRLQAATARVVNALLTVHGDPRARWILQKGYRDDYREHALSGKWQGDVVRVVFDRSFIDQGVRWIIDYKTSAHEGGDLDQFLDREVERYRPQLERYAVLAQKLGPEPVRVGLYFPLMRAWREWGASIARRDDPGVFDH
jgi:ATP-dependent helicase/nuclease subunit A